MRKNNKHRVDHPFVVWLIKPEVNTMTMQSNATQQQVHKAHNPAGTRPDFNVEIRLVFG